MSSFFEWLHMGGYAIYVWPTYALVGMVFLLNWVYVKRQKRRIRHQLHLWFKR